MHTVLQLRSCEHLRTAHAASCTEKICCLKTGMLFFDSAREPRISRMWMKNTYVPLDMIFIRSDWTILNIAGRILSRSRQTSSRRKGKSDTCWKSTPDCRRVMVSKQGTKSFSKIRYLSGYEWDSPRTVGMKTPIPPRYLHLFLAADIDVPLMQEHKFLDNGQV